MKISDLYNLSAALGAFAKEDQEKCFKLNAKSRLAVADAIIETEEALKPIESARTQLMKKFSADGKKVDEDKRDAFTEAANEFLEEERNFSTRLKVDDLNLEENAVSISVLTALRRYLG